MPSFLFTPVPNRDAVRFLQDKAPVAREVFDGLLPELRGLAFTITGVESMAILKKARERLSALPAGESWDAIKKDLAADLVPWLGDGAGKRAELLLRVHGYAAYHSAAHEVYARQTDVFPYWQWQTAGDEKVRASHAALDGKVFPHDWTGEWPTQSFGCRCQFIPLSEDDVGEIRQADAKLPPQAHRVVDGQRAARALANGLLETLNPEGTPTAIPITDPRLRSGAQVPGFWPTTDRAADLEGLRYIYTKTPEGAAAFATFEQWAQKTPLDETGRTLMDWLVRRPVPLTTPAALLAAPPATVPVATAAALLAADPASLAARVLKQWGDDDAEFQRLISSSDPASETWREAVSQVLRSLQPYASGLPLYRGMFFPDAAKQAAFLSAVRSRGEIAIERIATSATKDLAVATRSKFFNHHGVLWEVRRHRSARDIEPLLDVLPTTKGEREVLLLGGTRYRLVAEEARPVLVDGQTVPVPYLILEEI